MAANSKEILLLIFLGAACSTLGFLPRRILWTVRSHDLPLESVLTHKEITSNAILQVAADILRSNPNPRYSGSSARIDALNDEIDEERLIIAYYGPNQASRLSTFRSVIRAITNANSKVDLRDERRRDAVAHFDSEQFEAGQTRLTTKRSIIIGQMDSNMELARTETGQVLHTLQDFYSHSNWIENQNDIPHPSLGRANGRLTGLAESDTQTCTDCEVGDTRYTIAITNLFLRLVNPYRCRNNIVENLSRGNILTSGYHANQVDQNNQDIEIPTGKCSHGGLEDPTEKISPTGGINKDTPFEIWSPHYYLYTTALRIAQQATVDFLAEIRSEINNDNLFSRFLGVPLVEVSTPNEVSSSSVAYVIDTTGSMSEELPMIQATLPAIRNDLTAYVNSLGEGVQVRYILVPFNDPDPGLLHKTDDIDELLDMIGALTADGGGDTPEPSIGATIRAIEASEPGSPIHVFTDAGASDDHRINEAISLISIKGTRIYFHLVNLSLRRKRSLNKKDYYLKSRLKRQTESSVYQELATFSGGQILHVQTSDLSSLGSLVSFSALQNRHTIFYASGTSFSTISRVFPIDSSVLQATISISGQEIVSVIIFTPEGINAVSLAEYSISLETETAYIAQFNISGDTLRGNWTITVQSRGAYSIQVQGISEVMVSREIYQIDYSSPYGFSSINGKPLQGEPVVIIVTIENSNSNIIKLNKFNIINSNGNLIESINSLTNLTSVNEVSYAAAFTPSTDSFSLQLIGNDQNGYGFSYYFDTSVEVSSIFLVPKDREIDVVTISPGNSENIYLLLVNHGDSGTFHLSVSASNMSEFIIYDLTPNTTTIDRNKSVEITMLINVAEDSPEDLATTFTIIAESDINSANSNFIEVNVIVFTIPELPTYEEETPTTATSGTILPRVMMPCIYMYIILLFVITYTFS